MQCINCGVVYLPRDETADRDRHARVSPSPSERRVRTPAAMRCQPAALLLLVAALHAWHPPNDPFLISPIRHRRHSHAHTIQIFGWHLELHENRAIKSPYYDECKFYRGRILDEEQSAVTVTECGGQLYGLIRINNEKFVLQPTDRSDGAHVLTRRDVMFSEPQTTYNLTGDTVNSYELDIDEDSEQPPVSFLRSRKDKESDVEYFRNAMPVTRRVIGGKRLWLEMAIVADHTVLKFHGRDRVKHYILALMNIVSAIFNDPSLESNITLVINKLFLYEDKDPVIKFGNVKKSLEGANRWNSRHLTKLPEGSTGWDAMIWLTRDALGGPSGFAPVGGICSKNRSAAINRDEGLTSAFVIAHEIAHLLGLTHDGKDHCESAAHRGSVMATTVYSTLQDYVWSSCSKKQFHDLSKNWWCLHERSREEGVVLGGARELSSYVFTMDEQCRTEFGEGFSVCKSVKVRSGCSRLWCAHRNNPHVCRSKGAPPLEGTPCGTNQWCVDQVCEPMPGQVDRGNKIDNSLDEEPKWGEWGKWTDCSATCGYGLQTRHRHCRHKGSLSDACEGAASQVATCWSGKQCFVGRDPRSDFCRQKNTRLISYIPSEESKQCEQWCVDYSGGQPSYFGVVPDATTCGYNNTYDLCSQGTCVKGQCNGSDPSCYWCPDGYCSNNTFIYTKTLSKGWTRITVIPHEAHQLSVHIAVPVALRIAIRERKRDKHTLELNKHHRKRFEVENKENNYLKYDPNVPQNLQIVEVDSNVIDIKENVLGWEGEIVAAGALIKWRQTDNDIHISSTSAIQADLMIMATPENPLPVNELMTAEVSVNYSTPASRTRPLEYRWSTERGPCSVSCGGGVRLVRPHCSQHHCAPARYEHCNQHACEFSWAPGEWEECSATCGSDGIQERQLFCVPTNSSWTSRRELVLHSVSPALCPLSPPSKQQPCNQLPCPVYWQELSWTTCSTTCGRGTSYRPLVCPASNEVYCGPKPRERRRRCRVRRCPLSPRTRLTCPHSDPLQYCELFPENELRRNCKLTPFRKYCCNACREIENTSDRSFG